METEEEKSSTEIVTDTLNMMIKTITTRFPQISGYEIANALTEFTVNLLFKTAPNPIFAVTEILRALLVKSAKTSARLYEVSHTIRQDPDMIKKIQQIADEIRKNEKN